MSNPGIMPIYSASQTLTQTLALGNSAGSNQIDMNFNKIINTTTPTLSGDVTNKAYIDTTNNAASANALLEANTYTNTVSSNLVSYIDSQNCLISTSTQVVSAYELIITDAGKFILLDSAVAMSITVPSSGTNFPIGTFIDFQQSGVGVVTFVAGNGVILNSKGGLKSINGQWVGVTLIKTATNVWSLFGDLI